MLSPKKYNLIKTSNGGKHIKEITCVDWCWEGLGEYWGFEEMACHEALMAVGTGTASITGRAEGKLVAVDMGEEIARGSWQAVSPRLLQGPTANPASSHVLWLLLV